MLRDKLHHRPTSTLWFWPDGAAGEGGPRDWPPATAVCTLEWDSPGVVWVHGLLGTLSFRNMRELLDFCVRRGVHTIAAHRREGQYLPRAKPVGDHFEIDLRAILTRVDR